MQWLGDYKAAQTIDFKFDTTVGGLPSTLSAATVKVYKGSSSTTEVTTGVTVTPDFDSLTGIVHVTIDLSDAFYAAGNDYQVVLTAGMLGGNTIRRVLAMFSIENRCVNWAKVASPTTTVNLSGTTIGVLTALASGAITAASIASDAITSAKVQDGFLTAAKFASGAFDAVWTVASRVLTAGTNIVLAKGTGITGFNDLSAAQVNAEVVDGLNVDTYAEPGQAAPPATTTLVTKIGYLYKAFRNRKTQDATTMKLYADDATTVDQKATISDNGTTYDHGEIASGP